MSFDFNHIVCLNSCALNFSTCWGLTKWLDFGRQHFQRYFCRFYERFRFLSTVQSITLHWRHNGHGSVSNHQPHDCLLNCLFRRRSKKISKLRVTGLCAGNSPETDEFPAQMASNAENVSIWWRHHDKPELVQVIIRLASSKGLKPMVTRFIYATWSLCAVEFPKVVASNILENGVRLTKPFVSQSNSNENLYCFPFRLLMAWRCHVS